MNEYHEEDRECPQCLQVVPVTVESFVQRVANGSPVIQYESSMTCGPGQHYTRFP